MYQFWLDHDRACLGQRWSAGLVQVILSLTLSFAVVPLVHFTSSRAKMGSFVSGLFTRVVAVVLAAFIAGVNVYLIVSGIINNTFATASN